MIESGRAFAEASLNIGDTMERNVVVSEFLELRKLLNCGNKIANEVTEFSFKIEKVSQSEFRLLFCVISQFEENKIEISKRDRKGSWERSGFTKFRNFENFCSDFLNKYENKRSFNIEELLIMETQVLHEEFQDLLVSYAP